MRPPWRERVRQWLCKHFGHRPDPTDPQWCRRCGLSVYSTFGRVL